MTRDEQIARAAIEACAKVLAQRVAGSNSKYWRDVLFAKLKPAAIVASVPQAAAEFPAFEGSKTGLHEPWKNPLAPIAENLEIADGAIAFRDGVIANLRAQLAEAQQPATSSGAPEMPEIAQTEVVRMAREAGMHGFISDVVTTLDELYQFTSLVCTERDRQWRALREKDREDAARYRWLTQYAYVGECYTEVGMVLEIQNCDREVPSIGSGACLQGRERVAAAIDAAIAQEQKR
ncbi:hypothetical protein [Chitinolyticbacter meiyuanensis]|uniref:hypothetical protein n=1 Tax=Chitinolyticbacter meiyuanensis TaxID=682798 RepID=UPI0011E5F881|nr:hypothetical protein [Chitinolyticbacter meiyuanensis]